MRVINAFGVLALCGGLFAESGLASAESREAASANRLACASRTVEWSLFGKDNSDIILVDGTPKLHHVRVDGYARHWSAGIWAFVSFPQNAEGDAGSAIIGYTDPTNSGASQKYNEEKRRQMRATLDACLKDPQPTGYRR